MVLLSGWGKSTKPKKAAKVKAKKVAPQKVAKPIVPVPPALNSRPRATVRGTCRLCFWWDDNRAGPGVQIGECHESSPSPNFKAAAPAVFPRTKSDEWCAKWSSDGK